MDEFLNTPNNTEEPVSDRITINQNQDPSLSVWKKDLGTGWLITTGFLLIGIQFFIPLWFFPLTYLSAFLIGVISLMRTTKKKDRGLMLASILLILVPILLFYLLRLGYSWYM